jgi:hypothetical protein
MLWNFNSLWIFQFIENIIPVPFIRWSAVLMDKWMCLDEECLVL